MSNILNKKVGGGISVLSLFDGMSCGMLAFLGLDIKVDNYYAYEIDKYAIQTTQHNFPNVEELGDVFEADFTKYKDIDFLVGGSPCVPANSKIKTDKGYKRIVDIKIGDMVLTHKNRYRPVSRLYQRKTNHLYHIRFCGNKTINITGNHPVYVYRNNSFVFVRTDELTTDDYVCVNINQSLEKLNYSNDLLWLVGRAIADGYLSKTKNKVIISVGKSKIEEFEKHLKGVDYYVIHKDRPAPEYFIKSERLTELYSYFGNKKALNKYIPDEILNLPKEQLLQIWEGYISGDGYKRKDRPNTVMWCSSSEDLILSIGLLTSKLFGKYPTTSVRNGEYKMLPSGMCKTNISYNSQISITDTLNKSVKIVGDKLLIRIKSIEKEIIDTDVYNIETTEDHSYTVDNIIVHNCTYWSIAQKNDNREIEASGLGWDLFSQYVRAIREVKPKAFLYENNKSMSKAIYESISETFGFEPIMIDSALVSAQSRKRYYWCGILQDDGSYRKANISQPEDRGIILRDIINTDREKSRAIIGSIGRTTTREYFKKHQGQMAFEPVNIINGATGVAEPLSPKQVGSLPRPNGELSTSQAFRVYDIDHKSVGLKANGGGAGGKTGLYAIPIEFENDKPIKAVSATDGKTYPVYFINEGQIEIKGKLYPIKLNDGYYIIRKLTVDECKMLQTVPDWYEFPVSDSQAYKMLGNGWTVEVIKHLLYSIINDV